MRLKPGTVWLLLACLLAWPLTYTGPGRSLERNLYDTQLQGARLLLSRAALHEDIASIALDDRAVRQGFSKDDLQAVAENFAPQARLVSGRTMEPFYRTDDDGVLRSIGLVRKSENGLEFSPPFLHALAYRGIAPEHVRWEDDRIVFGAHWVTVDEQGRFRPLFPFQGSREGLVFGSVFGRTFRSLIASLPGVYRPSDDSLTPGTLSDFAQAEPLLGKKLLILGTYQAIADELERPTPTGNMVSMTLYTTTIDALFSGTTLRPLSALCILLLGASFLLVLCWTLPGQRHASAIGTWLVAVVFWLVLHQVLFGYGWYGQPAQTLLLATVALFTHMLLRSRQLQNVLHGLGGSRLAEQPESEIIATICFTNLPAHIKALEQSEPARAAAARVAYAHSLGRVVAQHGGQIVDQQGDAQMIAFGLDDQPQHAALAVACSLDIVAAVSRWLGEFDPSLIPDAQTSSILVHCGVVTGTIARGQVGGGNYRSVAAIGDTTNAAARLMGEAQKRGIGVLAAHSTTGDLGPRLESRPAGEVTLRGRQEALAIDEVLGFHSPPKPLIARPATVWPRSSLFLCLAATLLSLIAGWSLDRRLPLHFALLDGLAVSDKSAPIVFAGIDEESLAVQPWPWPRSRHAEVIENCRRAGVQCLFFDLVFDLPSADPDEDQALAQAVQNMPFVVLAAVKSEDSEPTLIDGLIERARWGLINVANDAYRPEHRVRRALWQLGNDPGAAQAIAKVISPQIVPKMENQSSFFFRWGSAPTTISYHRLLDPNDPVFAQLRGSVVIVGDNTPGSHDAFETPTGLRKGGFIHAMTTQTLLNDEVILDRSRGGFAILLALLFGAATLVLTVRSTGPGYQVFILAAMLSLNLSVVVVACQNGDYLGTQSLLTIPCALLLGVALKMMGASQALLHYVPRRLQKRLETEDTVADKEVWATVLVTDIRGYTGLSEHRSPLEILKLLNRYHELSAQCYEKQGGHLLTYQGDAQIVVFGAIDPLDSPVTSAIEACKLLPAVVAQVSAENGLSENDAIAVGAGIATGHLTVALLRAGEQIQYTVLGEPVRRAHNIQSLSGELQSSLLLDSESAQSIRDTLKTKAHLSNSGLAAYSLFEGSVQD